MDMPRSEVRDLRFDQFSVTKHLEHASAQAHQRNYQDFLIVDVIRTTTRTNRTRSCSNTSTIR